MIQLDEKQKQLKGQIFKHIKKGIENPITNEFMNKVYNHEIKNGDKILTVEEAKDWCLTRNINLNSDFSYFMLYWSVSFNPDHVNQYILGSWFNEEPGFGDHLKNGILEYYKKLIKE